MKKAQDDSCAFSMTFVLSYYFSSARTIDEKQAQIHRNHNQVKTIDDQHVGQLMINNLAYNPRNVADNDGKDKNQALALRGLGFDALIYGYGPR